MWLLRLKDMKKLWKSAMSLAKTLVGVLLSATMACPANAVNVSNHYNDFCGPFESNLDELASNFERTNHNLSCHRIDTEKIEIEGFQKNLTYIGSPDGVYVMDIADDGWTVDSIEAIDIGKDGIYTTYGCNPENYEEAGFSHMPDFYYSLATNGDCYLNQLDLGRLCGCVPTSLSMAIKLMGDKDFDYEDYFAYMEEQGYSFEDKGINFHHAVSLLGKHYKILAHCKMKLQ